MTPGRGRPPVDEPLDAVTTIRLSTAEKREVDEHAASLGMKSGPWMRKEILAALVRAKRAKARKDAERLKGE